MVDIGELVNFLNPKLKGHFESVNQLDCQLLSILEKSFDSITNMNDLMKGVKLEIHSNLPSDISNNSVAYISKRNDEINLIGKIHGYFLSKGYKLSPGINTFNKDKTISKVIVFEYPTKNIEPEGSNRYVIKIINTIDDTVVNEPPASTKVKSGRQSIIDDDPINIEYNPIYIPAGDGITQTDLITGLHEYFSKYGFNTRDDSMNKTDNPFITSLHRKDEKIQINVSRIEMNNKPTYEINIKYLKGFEMDGDKGFILIGQSYDSK